MNALDFVLDLPMPFWTVQNGIAGSTHTSRDGREVDFRPGRVALTNIKQDGTFQIAFDPAKGIRLPQLYLRGRVTNVDYRRRTATGIATFKGHEISVTMEHVAFYDGEIRGFPMPPDVLQSAFETAELAAFERALHDAKIKNAQEEARTWFAALAPGDEGYRAIARYLRTGRGEENAMAAARAAAAKRNSYGWIFVIHVEEARRVIKNETRARAQEACNGKQ